MSRLPTSSNGSAKLKIAKSFREFHETCGGAILAAGFFDGIHRGHAKVLSAAVSAARASGRAPWILTFDRHPFQLLAPDHAPRLLTSTPRKLELLESLGFEGCLLLPFTHSLAALSPREFMRRLSGSNAVKRIFCGGNWTFGAHAAGTPEVLRELGREFGFEVTVARAMRCLGDNISSTRIRRAIAAGDIAFAKRMLGRAPSVEGTVAHGRAVGRTIGRPTANLVSDYPAALPPDGVYAVRVFLEKNGAPFFGLANIGVRPTFHDSSGAPRRTFEIHLLDFDGDLYGREIRAEFLRFLRSEIEFESPDDLAAQIARDIHATRAIRRMGQNAE